jgi:hypothetical protein
LQPRTIHLSSGITNRFPRACAERIKVDMVGLGSKRGNTVQKIFGISPEDIQALTQASSLSFTHFALSAQRTQSAIQFSPEMFPRCGTNVAHIFAVPVRRAE